MIIFFLLVLLAGQLHASSDIKGPLTPDFQAWLTANGYSSYDFIRADYGTQGSYGGKSDDAPNVVNSPVVFIHGNSDAALHQSSSVTGWTNSIQYFLTQGYTSAELYATSWQDTNALNAQKRTHDCKDLVRLRKFLEAVLAYTGASKISVVSHSMGVTLAREIIKGGQISAKDGKCDLGLPLNKKVEVVVPHWRKLKENGLWPGDSCGLNYLDCGMYPLVWPCSGVNYASYLMKLNSDKTKEGDYVFSMWSLSDNLIDYGTMVWGRSTCLIPTSNGKVTVPAYTHMQTKELTYKDQYQMVKFKTIPY